MNAMFTISSPYRSAAARTSTRCAGVGTPICRSSISTALSPRSWAQRQNQSESDSRPLSRSAPYDSELQARYMRSLRRNRHRRASRSQARVGGIEHRQALERVVHGNGCRRQAQAGIDERPVFSHVAPERGDIRSREVLPRGVRVLTSSMTDSIQILRGQERMVAVELDAFLRGGP